jgi:hypothetical protein
MPQPIVPPGVNEWLKTPAALGYVQKYPLNLCAILSPEVQKDILDYVNRNYSWPQIQERHPFEPMWDAILDMYRIKHAKRDTNVPESSPAGKNQKETGDNNVRVADSVIHDAVERLTDITHFVSFKEGIPAQYRIPEYFNNVKADAFYDPVGDRLTAGNSVLRWNFTNEEIYRKHAIAARHFYLYGLAFARSEWAFEVTEEEVSDNFGRLVMQPMVTKLGTTFDPISIRKLWLNYRLSAYEMDHQPCPFFFEEMPTFAMLGNAYDPDYKPFGFCNLDRLQKAMTNSGTDNWMFTSEEMASYRRAIESFVEGMRGTAGGIPGDCAGTSSLATLLKEEHSVSALWHHYPMLPLDSKTGEWKTRADGSPVPFQRYVMNSYGQNFSGRQILLRLQRNYYPRDSVPLYGSSHMPDLDSGTYTPSLGQLLWNHYRELVTCMEQYFSNKDQINNPPAWVQVSSPAQNEDFNKPGAKIKVNGPNDFGWKQTPDATASTAAVLTLMRESAKETSKSTDALLGKAMGARTSATEASNAFQASMSAVTTPIDIFNHDLMGGFALRVWDYTGKWMPPEILKLITGQMGFVMSPQDMWLRVAVETNVGSQFIENIVNQQNIRYVVETTAMDQSVNRPEFLKMLFRQFKFPNAEALVNDQGIDREVEVATEQAIETFYGKQVMVSPDQNHAVAIRVKTRFLEDQESQWMTKYRAMAPGLVEQIQIHQSFLMIQMQQQMLHSIGGLTPPSPGDQAPGGSGMLMPPLMPGPGNAPPPGAPPPIMAGGAAQQGGSEL